jgi:vacuolar-type H+-ATPase subunit H
LDAKGPTRPSKTYKKVKEDAKQRAQEVKEDAQKTLEKKAQDVLGTQDKRLEEQQQQEKDK